jgi:Rod binding domain-containing protein
MAPASSVDRTPSGTAPDKLAAAAQEFESVLLGQWLQSAESSFGSVPGGDDDADSCGEQMQGFATQRLATAFTASGGIGIARLVESALVKAENRAGNGQSASGDMTPGLSSARHTAEEKTAATAAQAYAIGRAQ